MPFNIVKTDITKMSVEAVVNAANRELRAGSGVCGAIFAAAGYEELEKACREVSPVKTGFAALTPGFNLPASYIIHAVGPVYSDYSPEESRRLLYSAYKESLTLAKEKGLKSIAFPLISSGIYGYPKEEALSVAIGAIKDFLASDDMDVYLAILDKSSFVVSQKLLNGVNDYIIASIEIAALSRQRSVPKERHYSVCSLDSSDIRLRFSKRFVELDEPFNTTLLRLIKDKNMTDVEVYKKANIDRKLFSKIRTGRGYMPGKRTVLALAIALELNLDETKDLLERAGFALSPSLTFDVIIEYFIVNKKYDIYEINEVLFSYDQQFLGM